MNNFSDEDVVAFVDGRLAAEKADAIKHRMEQDQQLASRIASHRWISRQICAAYRDMPASLPNAELLARLWLNDGNVLRFESKVKRSTVSRYGMVGALAASLVAGLIFGRLFVPATSILKTDGRDSIVASGMLADSLSNKLSGQAGLVRIGLSFKTSHGVCRTFSTSDGTSGIGCRSGEEWIVPIVIQGHSSAMPSGDYRLASGSVDPAVMAQVDTRIIGEPLTLPEEGKARAGGWN